MSTSIERFLRSPIYDPQVVVRGVNSYLEKVEGMDWITDLIPRLNRPVNRGRPKELYQKASEYVISQINNPDSAHDVLTYAIGTKNYYILSRLLDSYVLRYLGSALKPLAERGDLIGLEMILESPRKNKLKSEDFSGALKAAAKGGQVEAVRLLYEQFSEPPFILLDEIYDAIEVSPATQNWRTIFELLINIVPEEDRADVLLKMGQSAAREGNAACLRYLYRKNLIQNWNNIFSVARGSSLDFFLDPNSPIPLSDLAIYNRLGAAIYGGYEDSLTKLLGSKKIAPHYHYSSLHIYNELLRIVDRNLDKISWENLTQDLSGFGFNTLFNGAVQYHCFKILKAFADRPDFLIYLDFSPARLEESVDVCRDCGRHELAQQLNSIVSERKRCDNQCLRVISRISRYVRDTVERSVRIQMQYLDVNLLFGINGKQVYIACLIYFTAERAFQLYRWANS